MLLYFLKFSYFDFASFIALYVTHMISLSDFYHIHLFFTFMIFHAFKFKKWQEAQSLSYVQLLVTLWTVTRHAPLSMGLSGKEYWSGLPFPPPGDLPDLGIVPVSPVPPAFVGRFFTTEPPGKLWEIIIIAFISVSFDCCISLPLLHNNLS